MKNEKYNLKKILKKLNVRDFKDRYLKIENDVTSLVNKDSTALIEIRTNTRTLNKKDECYYSFKEAKLLSQVGGEFFINSNKELTTIDSSLKLENSDMKRDKMVLKPGDFYIKFLKEDIKQFYELIEEYRLVKISFNNYTLKIEGYKKEEEAKILLEKHNESCDVDREYYAILSTSILKQFKKILVDEPCLKFYLYNQMYECFKIESCNCELNIFIAPVRKAGE